MKVSKIYEGKVILTTIYLINRMSSQVLAFKSSIYTILESFPDFQGIVSLPPKIYGCYSFVHVHNHNLRSKHDPKALKCIFLGYSHTQKGYKCYHPPNKRKCITMDVTFIGNKPYFFETCLQGESNKIVEDRWQVSAPQPLDSDPEKQASWVGLSPMRAQAESKESLEVWWFKPQELSVGIADKSNAHSGQALPKDPDMSARGS